MPLFRGMLIVLGLIAMTASLAGCGDKQTIKTGKTEDIKQKFPGPPDAKSK